MLVQIPSFVIADWCAKDQDKLEVQYNESTKEVTIKPVVQKLYDSVKCGNEAQISIDSNSKPDYREKLEAELKALRESEMWQTAVTVRKLRPENN